MTDQLRPRVGVAAFVLREGRFLMGLRRGSHGAGTWSLPGGHLELGESFEQAARREVAEETGVEITNVRFGAVTNDVFDAHRHYVTIWMISDHLRGSPQVREPDKFVDLRWMAPPTMPDPLFLPMRNLLDRHDLDHLLGDSHRQADPSQNRQILAEISAEIDGGGAALDAPNAADLLARARTESGQPRLNR